MLFLWHCLSSQFGSRVSCSDMPILLAHWKMAAARNRRLFRLRGERNKKTSENRMDRIQIRPTSDTPLETRGFAALWRTTLARSQQKLVTELHLINFFDLIYFRPVLICSLEHLQLQLFVFIEFRLHEYFAFLKDLEGLLPHYSIKKIRSVGLCPCFDRTVF